MSVSVLPQPLISFNGITSLNNGAILGVIRYRAITETTTTHFLRMFWRERCFIYLMKSLLLTKQENCHFNGSMTSLCLCVSPHFISNRSK